MTALSSWANRVLFVVAFALAGLAVCEKLANLMGRTLTVLGNRPPSRLLELAAVAVLFVIALQLRDIKQLTAGGTPSGK